MAAKKKEKQEVQLSLFENNEIVTIKEPTVLEFVRARFDHGPEMTQEEYKRWIKILVNKSIRSMD
jgi:hypothetical protein